MVIYLMSQATRACHPFTFPYRVLNSCFVITRITISTKDLCFFFFFFSVPNTYKKTDDFVTSNVPAVDLDHKFRCKVVDCLKFFRKAKLLHYHMKYFHGMEKSLEPEESPGKRHVQTRGSSASDKGSQESLTRKRVSASSPSKYLGSALCHGGVCCSGHSADISDTESKWEVGLVHLNPTKTRNGR
jgi:hypothetical protein